MTIVKLFKQIYDNRTQVKQLVDLEKCNEFLGDLYLDDHEGKFPDRVLRDFTLTEMKSSKTYTISSFNSHLPTGLAPYKGVMRECYYAVHAKKNKDSMDSKLVIVHGSFWELTNEQRRRMLVGLFTKRWKSIFTNEEWNTLNIPKRISESNVELSSNPTESIEDGSVKVRERIMVADSTNLLRRFEHNTMSLIVPEDKIDNVIVGVNNLFGEHIEFREFPTTNNRSQSFRVLQTYF